MGGGHNPGGGESNRGGRGDVGVGEKCGISSNKKKTVQSTVAATQAIQDICRSVVAGVVVKHGPNTTQWSEYIRGGAGWLRMMVRSRRQRVK